MRQLILDAVASGALTRGTLQFELNRFNLVLDFESARARIDEETDVTPAGTVELPITELVEVLRRAPRGG